MTYREGWLKLAAIGEKFILSLSELWNISYLSYGSCTPDATARTTAAVMTFILVERTKREVVPSSSVYIFHPKRRGAIHSTKIPTGPTEKRRPPQKGGPVFSKLNWTEFWKELSGNCG